MDDEQLTSGHIPHPTVCLRSLDTDLSLALLAGVRLSCAGVRLGSGWTPEIRRDRRRGIEAGSGVDGATSVSTGVSITFSSSLLGVSFTKLKSNCLLLTLSSLVIAG